MRHLVLVSILAAGLISAPAATAQTDLPVGEADGVRMVRNGEGALVVVFTPAAERLWQRVRGRYVEFWCVEMETPSGDGLTGTSEGGTSFKAPSRGRRLRTGDLTRGMDYCSVSLPQRRIRRKGHTEVIPEREIVAVPLTQRGAIYLDERATARRILLVGNLAAIVKSRNEPERWPTSDEMLRAAARFRLRLRLVALPGPMDSPPPGSIGYWSDANEHAVMAALSKTGRRLFFEVEPDEVLRTNLTEYMFGEDD